MTEINTTENSEKKSFNIAINDCTFSNSNHFYSC